MKIDIAQTQEEEINLAPLIDCVFLLLIFFMVAATLDKQENVPEPIKEILITLPAASSSIETSNMANPYAITIDAKGRYYSPSGSRLSTQDLHKKLKSLAQANPDQRIRIEGDKTSSYQDVVHLLDLCQFVGLTNVGVRTD